MKPDKLKAEFLRLCRRELRLGDPLGTEEGQEKKAVTFALLYPTAKLELVYRFGTVAASVTSTLYCRVYPDKNSPLYLHLPQILPLLEVEDYRACYFPFIENSQRMAECLAALTKILEPLLPKLEKLGRDGGDRALLTRWIKSVVSPDTDPERVLRRDSDEYRAFLWLMAVQEEGWICRYTQFGPWQRYVFGEPEKALSQYRKKKDLTEYELGLCAFLEKPEGKAFRPMPPECFAQKDMKEVSAGKDDFGTIVKCVLVVYALCAVAGCLVMGLVQLISAWGTVCWFGAPWWSGFILGGLPAVFGGIALRRRIIPLVCGKKAKQKLEFDDITNATPFAEKLAAVTFALSLCATVFFGAMMSGDVIRLYESHGQYTPETFCFQEFEYSEIVAVYHIDARHNMDGDRIDRASYVIVLEDGTVIDLDGYATVKQTEKKVLPLLERYEIDIIELDSDRDLPGEAL